jgi:cell shape-determining protein MreC
MGRCGKQKNPIRGILKGTGEWDRLQFVFEDAPGDTAAGDVIATPAFTGRFFPVDCRLAR